MRIEFTVDISNPNMLGNAGRDGRIDRGRLVDLAWAAESAGIDRLRITDGDGAQDTASIASYFLHATAALGVEIEQRAGVLPPEVAALQIATLDQLSGGRVTVRLTPSIDDVAASHEESFARLDEYIVLLKRLWSNDKPIDFEGRFHRLQAAFSGAKPFAADCIPIALSGASGTAVAVAARHADVFVLPAATIEETRRTIERVRQAAAGHRRADTVRFALPVRPAASGKVASIHRRRQSLNLGPTVGWSFPQRMREPAGPSHPRAGEAVVLAGSMEKLALTLLDYAEVGVTDFIVAELRTAHEMSAFGKGVASLVRNALAHRSGHQAEEPRSGFAGPVFARRSRYPA